MKNRNVNWISGLPTPTWEAGHYRTVVYAQTGNRLCLVGEQLDGEFVAEVHRANVDGTYTLIRQRGGFKSIGAAESDFGAALGGAL